MHTWWRRVLAADLERVRRDGRERVAWSARITVAATASYIVGTLIFPGTQPLLAPLTAMLVVQVTPISLLASGVDRVIAVVAGVLLAIGFAAVVPLAWWSLGLLILIALTIGQYLRLRSNLLEVAISAMLVLGVGTLGAEAAAGQRIAETLVGAAGGVLMTLLFPPKVAVSDAGHAIDGLADRISALLSSAAGEVDEIAAEGDPERLADRLRSAAAGWLGDSRQITYDIPQVGAALLKAEEGRRLNVRGLSTPYVEPGLRQGLEALEHTAVSIRGLMRDLAESADGGWLVEPGASGELNKVAQCLREMAAGIDAFGELVRNEGDVRTRAQRGRHRAGAHGARRPAPHPRPARRGDRRQPVHRGARAAQLAAQHREAGAARARPRPARTPTAAAEPAAEAAGAAPPTAPPTREAATARHRAERRDAGAAGAAASHATGHWSPGARLAPRGSQAQPPTNAAGERTPSPAASTSTSSSVLPARGSRTQNVAPPPGVAS